MSFHNYPLYWIMSSKLRAQVLTGFFLTVSIIVVYSVINRHQPVEPELKTATQQLELEKIALQREHLRRNADLSFYGAAGAMTAACLSGLLLASGMHRAQVKRASVHTYRIGQSEVVIHERDLGLAAPIAMGLMNAEQLRQMNGGIEKAFELSCRMAEVQNSQLRALMHNSRLALPEKEEPEDIHKRSEPIPTFSDLIRSGDLAHGKPMILGYINGVPRRGSFLDIYSAAVAGESGSGKTSTLLFLIGSGLISENIRFYGIDPHYPHPKSLGYKTKALWSNGAMTMATSLDQGREVLSSIGDMNPQRFTQQDTSTTPIVLVLDELAFLMKTTIAEQLAATMTRVSTEGRKCAVYMLASSQTWLVESTGKTSVVRDTLTSAYIHKIKPRQANLILQDRDETEKVKRYVKHAGEVLLCSVQNDSVIAKMPYTTEEDMQSVNDMVNSAVNSQRVDQAVDQTSQPTGLVTVGTVDLVDQVHATLKNDGDFMSLVTLTGLDKAYISRILNRKQQYSRRVEEGFQKWLMQKNIDKNP